MKRQISKMELKKKSEQLNELITNIIKGEVSIPNNSLVFLDSKTLIEVFTKRRMELIQYINKYKPKTIQTLADLTQRKKQAVNRDLKMLESHELVKLEKKGRTVTPQVDKIFLVFELTEMPKLGS